MNFDMEDGLIQAYPALLFTIIAPLNTTLSVITTVTAPTTPTEKQ